MKNKSAVYTDVPNDVNKTTSIQEKVKAEKSKSTLSEKPTKSIAINELKEELIEPKVVYSIQIASMTKPFNPKNFPSYAELNNIVERKEEDLYKYTAGEYYKLEEALMAQKEIRSKGIKGAFVVAYQGNKRIKV
jgi:hypothetical protein